MTIIKEHDVERTYSSSAESDEGCVSVLRVGRDVTAS